MQLQRGVDDHEHTMVTVAVLHRRYRRLQWVPALLAAAEEVLLLEARLLYLYLRLLLLFLYPWY